MITTYFVNISWWSEDENGYKDDSETQNDA